MEEIIWKYTQFILFHTIGFVQKDELTLSSNGAFN